MKKPLLLTLALFAFVTAVGHSQPPAPAAPATSTAQVSLRVDVKNIRPEKEPKSKDQGKPEDKDKPKPETVTKSMEVKIAAAKAITGPLKIVTIWYARDLASKDQVVANKEESEVPLDEKKTTVLSVKPFGFTSTPSHKAKGPDGKVEKVDGSGQTFSGWVIRAYDGTTLVGEAASSPPLLKLAN